jgi:Ion channel.
MASIIILFMTTGILLYFFQSIWKGRKYLLKYISTVGQKKPVRFHFKPVVWVPFLTIHGMIGCYVGYQIFQKESDGIMIYRLLLSIISAFIILLLLYVFYFIMIVIIKEMIYMKDRTIIFILIFSVITSSLLFGQIYVNKIEYPKAFIWSSAVLYLVNLFGIGRIIWTIFKKEVPVKSIWSLAIINISFIIISLSNIVYAIQLIYPTACYSRPLNSWGDALYFVVISFFTVGYGDLYPIHHTTKILSMIIILSGFTFTAVFVSAALSATVEHFGNIIKK